MIDNYKGAWHGSAELKAEVMERLLLHRQHDEIIQGHYQWYTEETHSGYKGCAVGCTLPKMKAGVDWHEKMNEYYNIPAEVAYLIDNTFESQAEFAPAAEFAVASIAAIAVGADLRPLARRLENLEWAYDNCGVDNCNGFNPCPGACTDYIRRLDPDWVIAQFKAAPIATGARAMILVG
jgi:hypothetical protein